LSFDDNNETSRSLEEILRLAGFLRWLMVFTFWLRDDAFLFFFLMKSASISTVAVCFLLECVAFFTYGMGDTCSRTFLGVGGALT
jgi:hypothetical protein